MHKRFFFLLVRTEVVKFFEQGQKDTYLSFSPNQPAHLLVLAYFILLTMSNLRSDGMLTVVCWILLPSFLSSLATKWRFVSCIVFTKHGETHFCHQKFWNTGKRWTFTKRVRGIFTFGCSTSEESRGKGSIWFFWILISVGTGPKKMGNQSEIHPEAGLLEKPLYRKCLTQKQSKTGYIQKTPFPKGIT